MREAVQASPEKPVLVDRFLAEENAAAQYRRRLQSEHGLDAVSGLWGRALSDLVVAGHDVDSIATGLQRVHVEPVLTAHPTEAKRRTTLETQRRIFLLTLDLHRHKLNQEEQQDRLGEILQFRWNDFKQVLDFIEDRLDLIALPQGVDLPGHFGEVFVRIDTRCIHLQLLSSCCLCKGMFRSSFRLV